MSDIIVHRTPDHKYFDNLGREYMSVTTFIGKEFPFDRDAIIDKVIKNPKSRYYKKDPEDVKTLWDKTATEGNAVHESCETYINERKITDDVTLKPLVEQFARLNFKGKLRSEIILWDSDLLIAGTCDILEEFDSLTYVYDIKTSRLVDDDKLYKFSIQLEMYRRFYEKMNNKTAIAMGIFHFEDFINKREKTRLKFIKAYDVKSICDDMLSK